MPTFASTQSCSLDRHLAPIADGDPLPFSHLAVVAGAARSGTSWIGQILDSSPDIAYRFQPFFAYAFQGRVARDSPRTDWVTFLRDLYHTEDPFVLQTQRRTTGEYPTFDKSDAPHCLAVKTCRYQYLLSPMLQHFPNLKLLAVIRHPAAVINSWLRTPSEFPAGADIRHEWRFGACKNLGKESEFFGYYKWKEVAHLYLDLRDQYPDRVHIQRYESLVDDSMLHAERIFKFLQIPLADSTRTFLDNCHKLHHDSPFSVFKNTAVQDRWRSELPESIASEIIRDLERTRLEEFIR